MPFLFLPQKMTVFIRTENHADHQAPNDEGRRFAEV
jgi:hypothetical protein